MLLDPFALNLLFAGEELVDVIGKFGNVLNCADSLLDAVYSRLDQGNPGECFSDHMSVSWVDTLLGDFQKGCAIICRLP